MSATSIHVTRGAIIGVRAAALPVAGMLALVLE